MQSSVSYYDFSDSVPTHLLNCCHRTAAEQPWEPSAMWGLGRAAVRSLRSWSEMANTVHNRSEMTPLSDHIHVFLKWLNDQTHQHRIVIFLERMKKKKRMQWLNWEQKWNHICSELRFSLCHFTEITTCHRKECLFTHRATDSQTAWLLDFLKQNNSFRTFSWKHHKHLKSAPNHEYIALI